MSGDVSPANSAGLRNGTSAPYCRAMPAMSSESVETITDSNTPLSRAAAIVYASIGWPPSSRTFFPVTRFEPLRAGIKRHDTAVPRSGSAFVFTFGFTFAFNGFRARLDA